MGDIDYRVFDADNHYYETRDAFMRYMEPAFRDRAFQVEKGPDGEDRMFLDEKPYTYIAPKFDKTNPPGSLVQILKDKGNVKWEDSYVAEEMHPAYVNRDARLELMDEQGLGAAVLLPTLAVCIEHPIRHDPALTFAHLRAFNRWLEDDWGYAHQNRIFAVPLLSLLDLDLAIEELERVLALGARMIHLKAGPVDGRSPADPHFDAFWARLEESGAALVFHIADSGYNERYSVDWGEHANPPVREQSAFQWATFHGDRPIMDTLTALVCHNLFGRFPGIRVMSIENGSGWVDYLVTNMNKKKGMGRFGLWPGGRPAGRLGDIFKRHVYVSPYPEDDVLALVEFLGPDHVLFGSDFPHPEGLADPLGFVDLMPGLPVDQLQRVMCGNTSELLGVDIAS
ncbi:amidohydrolase [Myxococcota bacterium]|nr:amidohydrolase [Myxococcota bacterium]